MLHPALARLATQPGLLVEHAGAYAELAAAEAALLGRCWQRRAVLGFVAAGGALLALGLGGAALLLAGALPAAAMPAPWLLVAVPAVPLLVALTCAAALLHDPAPPPFAHLHEQLAADVQFVRRQVDGA